MLAYRSAARVGAAAPRARRCPLLGRVGGRIGGLPQRANREMAARHQRRVTGRTRRRRPSTRSSSGTAATGSRCSGCRTTCARRVIAENFDAEGYEHITAGLARGNGVILALPHLGGWEWAAAWMAEQGHHMLAVVEALEPPELLDWFARQREAMGLEVVAARSRRVDDACSARSATTASCACCATATSPATASRSSSSASAPRCRRGPATLALRTGAALLPTAVYFAPGRGHRAVIRPPITVERDGPAPRRHRAHHAGARDGVRGADPRRAPHSGTCSSRTGRATANREVLTRDEIQTQAVAA